MPAAADRFEHLGRSPEDEGIVAMLRFDDELGQERSEVRG
jgi:hypothetical protein